MKTERLARLRERMAALQLPAMLISQPLNRYYLSGFSGSAGTLFVTADRAVLLTDSRYTERAAGEAPGFEIVKLERDVVTALPDLVAQVGVDRVGFESAHVTCAEYKVWAEKVGEAALVPTQGVVEGTRAVKEEEELALIRQAVAIADAAYAHLKQTIRPGMTEKQVAWDLEVWMRTHGADGIAFDLIVASGPNGAMPHALASDREIRAGEPIVVDMGARVRGYHSDLTRTLYLGEADGTFRQVYDIVLRAQQAAEARLAPGALGPDVDATARAIIAEAGYGDNFGHGLGHGVGLAVHELPGLNQRTQDTLAPGHVVTVEPGVYLTGWGGVRIEDMALITESGAEILTQADKDPFVRV
ncbi:MAG: Xaa-Pro peptidase family protein [Anaerolineae bacterium]|nr:Xaa-Pro peptidase family protein [Anaerolineae bacterium]